MNRPDEKEMKLVRGVTYEGNSAECNQMAASETVEEEALKMLREEADSYSGFFQHSEAKEETAEGEKVYVRGVVYDVELQVVQNAENEGFGNTNIQNPEASGLSTVAFYNPYASARANVFEPVPKDVEEFAVKKAPDTEDVVKGIIATGKVCSFRKNLYGWSERPARYFKLSGNDAQLMIHRFYVENYPKSFPLSGEIDEVRRCLLYHSGIAVTEKVPLPPEVWPFADGLVNIRTGEQSQYSRCCFYTESLTAEYDSDAECPIFEHFLASCMCYDAELTELVWRVIGYLLSSDTKAKKFFVFLGPKDSGKSLMANVIASLLEESAVSAMSINDFGTRFAVSELVDKHLAVCMDLSNETLSQTAVGMVKAITGGDKIRAEAKYQSAVTTPITAKLLFGSNYPLQIKEADSAFSDRQVAIPFLNPVPKEKQDRWLLEKIKQEIQGITIKAAAAYLRLVDDGYSFGETAKMEMLPVEVDHTAVIRKFAETRCDFSDDKAKISTEELYRDYSSFVLEYRLPSTDKSLFSQKFKEVTGMEKKKLSIRGASLWGYVGVKLK